MISVIYWILCFIYLYFVFFLFYTNINKVGLPFIDFFLYIFHSLIFLSICLYTSSIFSHFSQIPILQNKKSLPKKKKKQKSHSSSVFLKQFFYFLCNFLSKFSDHVFSLFSVIFFFFAFSKQFSIFCGWRGSFCFYAFF